MFNKRWIQREKLRAVHDNDLEGFLSSIGVLDQIRKGYHHCIVCDTPIAIENLGAVYPKENKINFVCERLSCLGKVNLYIEGPNE
jgi:hypothetical protein